MTARASIPASCNRPARSNAEEPRHESEDARHGQRPGGLPAQAGYGGAWHAPQSDRWMEVRAPGTGELLMRVAEAGREDVAGPRARAREGHAIWRRTARWRAAVLRRVAQRLRQCRPAGPAGCAGLRQSGERDGLGRHGGRRAAGLLRRAGDGAEGRHHPDGAGRPELHRARAAGRGRAHRGVQSSAAVRHGQAGRAAGGGQRRHHRRRRRRRCLRCAAPS